MLVHGGVDENEIGTSFAGVVGSLSQPMSPPTPVTVTALLLMVVTSRLNALRLSYDMICVTAALSFRAFAPTFVPLVSAVSVVVSSHAVGSGCEAKKIL